MLIQMAGDPLSSLQEQLSKCVVHLEADSKVGTGSGFFVAPGLILTCAHVVRKGKDTSKPAGSVMARWRGTECVGSVLEHHFLAEPFPDLALVSVKLTDHPMVLLQSEFPREGDPLWSYGYPDRHQAGDSVGQLVCEGWNDLESPSNPLARQIKLTHSELRPGMSGSPLLNLRSGAVCGVISITRGKETLLGGRAVPIAVAIHHFPSLNELLREADTSWVKCLSFDQLLQPCLINRPAVRDRIKSELQAPWLLAVGEQRRILDRDIDHHATVIPPPLAEVWQSFQTEPGWRSLVDQALGSIRELGSERPELREVVGATETWQLPPGLTGREVQQKLGALPIPATKSKAKAIADELDPKSQRGRLGGRPHLDERTRQLLQDIGKLRKNLYDLETTRDFPAFSRCFLVLGSLGSGKSHFVAWLLDQKKPEPANVLYLALGEGDSNLNLQALIAAAICKASKRTWPDIDAFHAVLAPTDMRLVIVIDDLQLWCRRRASFLNDLVTQIEEFSRWDAIYWLITLHDTNLDQVLGYEPQKVWNDYGYPGQNRPDPSDITAPRSRAPLRNASWIYLDEYNYHARDPFGLKILKAELRKRGDEQASTALDVISSHSADTEERAGEEGDEGEELLPSGHEIHRHLANPGIAWIAIDLNASRPNDFPIRSIVNLRYIEFTDGFLELRRGKLKSPSQSGSGHEIKQTVELVARAFSEFKNLDPSLAELKQQVHDLAARDPEVGPGFPCDLEPLEAMNLLQVAIEDASPSSSVSRVKRARLGFWFYWSRELAESMRRAHAQRAAADDGSDTRDELIKQFQRIPDPEVREGIWEFYLLLTDREFDRRQEASPGRRPQKPKLDREAGKFWRFGLEEPAWPTAAVWFAGSKASLAAQRYLADWAKEKLDVASLAPRTLFGLMNFVDQTNAVIAPKRIALLRPFFERIHTCSFSSYFRFIAARALSSELDNSALVEIGLQLSGCEKMALAEDLADLLVLKWETAAGQDFVPFSKLLFSYLARSGEEATEQYQARPSAGEWRRHFFREWVIHTFARLVVCRHETEAYDTLAKVHWYGQKDARIVLPIQSEMKREGSIAFGWWFRHMANGKGRADYIKLVGKLADHRDSHRRETALYFIIHTVARENRLSERVFEEFVDFLTTLRTDRELSRQVQKNADFFAFNLDAPFRRQNVQNRS
jgi:hypothetical protein